MIIRNQTFRNEEVRLDFHSFEECVFDRCRMVYGGFGPVSVVGCEFHNVQWIMVDAAQSTLQFMRGLYHGCGDGGRELVEQTFDAIRLATARGE